MPGVSHDISKWREVGESVGHWVNVTETPVWNETLALVWDGRCQSLPHTLQS